MRYLEGHTREVQALAWSPDGRWLYSAGDDTTLRRWDVQTGQETGRQTQPKEILALAVSPDGSAITSGGHDRRVYLWQPEEEARTGSTGQEHSATSTTGSNVTWMSLPHSVTALSFSANGEWLAAGADSRGSPQGSLRVRYRPTGEIWSPVLPAEVSSAIWSLAFSPGEPILASGHGGGGVLLWSPAQHRRTGQISLPHGVEALSFSPDGAELVTLARCEVTLWELRPAPKPRFVLAGPFQRAWTVSFAPDGRHLVVGSWDGQVRLLDARTGAERAKFDWRLRRIRAVACAPDGMTAAAAGDEPRILIWDVADVAW